MLELLRTNRELRWVFCAQVVSFLGDWFVFVALAGYIDDATGSEILVSLVLVSLSLPSFLASPLAGPVVDAFDSKRLLVVVSLLQACAACGLLLLNADRIWVAFVFQGLIAALAAFVKPAIDAGVPSLARSPEELRKANALFGSTWGVMLAVGAGLGGVFSQAFGRRAAIIADVITFIVAAGFFLLVRRPMQPARADNAQRSARVRPLADMHEAVVVARRDPVILALMSSKATFGIGAGIVSQLAVLSSEAFGSGDRGTGLLLGAPRCRVRPRTDPRRPLGTRVAAAHPRHLRVGGDRVRRVLHARGVVTGAGVRGRRRGGGPPRRRRPVDDVDVRPATARRSAHPRAGDGRRLRHRHPRRQPHQLGRRRAVVGGRRALGDHDLRRRRAALSGTVYLLATRGLRARIANTSASSYVRISA